MQEIAHTKKCKILLNLCNLANFKLIWGLHFSVKIPKISCGQYKLLNYEHFISCLKTPFKLLGSTTCRLAVRLKKWLLTWYTARQRQRKKHCALPILKWSLAIIISLTYSDSKVYWSRKLPKASAKTYPSHKNNTSIKLVKLVKFWMARTKLFKLESTCFAEPWSMWSDTFMEIQISKV